MKHIKIILGSLFILVLSTHTYASMDTEQFCFKDNTVKGKEVVESNLVTLHGLKKDETLKLKGIGGYMLNGVYMGREESKVKNGDQIRLIHDSIDEDGAKVSTVLIVGNTYDVFTTVTDKGSLSKSKHTLDNSSCRR